MTKLYRAYGPGMELLYVGITDHYETRMAQHSEKAWWSSVVRLDVTEFADRNEAAAAELHAIAAERPRYNRTGNGGSRGQSRRIPQPRAAGKFRREMVSVSEAADYAGVCTKTIRRRIADGSLTGYRFGPRALRVDMNEVDALLRPIPTAKSEAAR